MLFGLRYETNDPAVEKKNICAQDAYCADFLPLPIQLSLIVGLLETSCLSALRHLDSILKCRSRLKRKEPNGETVHSAVLSAQSNYLSHNLDFALI